MSNAVNTREQEIAEIAREIERYLDAHPNAADSVEGILRWWLTRQRYEQSAEHVTRALEHLVSAGVVRLYRTPGDRWVYCRKDRFDT